MGGKDAKTKTKSKQHKKHVQQDIKKRVKKMVRRNRAEVGDVSSGSRVVYRTRGDVYRSPPYRPDRIKSGGYYSTFPSHQGVLDRESYMMNLYAKGMK